MNCPLCQGASTLAFSVKGYDIRDCGQCGHRFAGIATSTQHVAQVYGDDYFFGGGAGYADYLKESDLLEAHGRRYGELLRRYAQPGTLLDVGSAAGFILKGLRAAGWSCSGVEPNATMAAYARDTLGLTVHTGALEDFTPAAQVDVVTMVQVVAHFYDVGSAFRTVAACLRPGGLLLIETWDRASLPARLLGRNWHEYSPPSVLHWFSGDKLRDTLGEHGFAEVARGQPRKFLNGEHAKSLLRFRMGAAAKLLDIIPDRMVFPYPAFDLFWGLYRRS